MIPPMQISPVRAFFPAIIMAGMLSLVPTGKALGQGAPLIDQIIQQQQQIITREQQLRDAERRDVQGGTSGPSLDLVTPLPQLEAGEGACLDISEIVLEGVKSLSDEVLKAEVRVFEARCLGIEELQNVIRVITNYYIGRGYITSRAYLVPQDVAGGVLKVLVVEGGVEELQILQNETPRGHVAQIFGARDGRILNIRDLEQGLDQINRLGSRNATIRIEPGREVGGSIVYIDVEKTHTVALSTAVNNDGSLTTGRHQSATTATFDDVLGLHESLTLSGRTSLDELRRRIYSRSLNGYFSIPWHYLTFNLSGSYLEYKSEFRTLGQAFTYDGYSWESRAGVDWVAYRDQRFIARLGAGLTVKESRNFIQGLFIETSSQRLSVAEVSGNLSGQVLSGFASLGLTFRHGIPAFGAITDAQLPQGSPRAQFRKFEVSGFYQRAFPTDAGVFSVSVNSLFAASPDTLFASERVSLGGPSTVRGFRDDSLAGEVGGHAQVELRWSPPATLWDEGAAKFIGRPQVYAGVDNGWLFRDAGQKLSRHLSGGAVGLRTSGGLVSGEISYELPFSHPSLMRVRKDGFMRFRVGVNATF